MEIYLSFYKKLNWTRQRAYYFGLSSNEDYSFLNKVFRYLIINYYWRGEEKNFVESKKVFTFLSFILTYHFSLVAFPECFVPHRFKDD